MASITSLILLQAYKKNHIQSVYNVNRMNLKTGNVVVINLFRRRILLYSPSH